MESEQKNPKKVLLPFEILPTSHIVNAPYPTPFLQLLSNINLESKYLDWHYLYANNLDSDHYELDATVSVFAVRKIPKYQTSVIVFRIDDSILDFWFFEETGAADFFTTSKQLKVGDKIKLTVWNQPNKSSPCYVRNILIVRPPRVPIGVKFSINYSDSTSLNVSTKDSLTTLETIQFIIRCSSNDILKETLTDQMKFMCVSCGKLSKMSCLECNQSICGNCHDVHRDLQEEQDTKYFTDDWDL